jgi:predicted nucleic acid-binding protein
MEALGFLFQDQDAEDKITKFCNMFQHLYLTEEVEKQTIFIRKAKKIKLPDAIIAATAIVHNLTLVTCNSDDFKNISNLNIFNPCHLFQS